MPRETGDLARQLHLILYPKDVEDEVVETLEACRVPGYTEFPKLIGRGPHTRHFDTSIWPGAVGAVFTVIRPEQAAALVEPFRALNRELDARTNGLHGLHMFVWPCQQVI
jgi:hypothetical protein